MQVYWFDMFIKYFEIPSEAWIYDLEINQCKVVEIASLLFLVTGK